MNSGLVLTAVLTALLASPRLASGADRKATRIPPGQLSINGYVHVQWLYDFRETAAPRQGFDLRRARIEVRYDLADAAAEIEVGCDELEVTVKDAYLEYRVSPALGFVAGLRKMPFSREELTPVSKLLVIERSEMNDMFGDAGFLGRDIGLALEGKLPWVPIRVEYAAGVYNGNGDRAFEDYDDAKQFGERLTVQPAEQLTLGLSATQRNDSLTGRVVTAYGADVSWQRGKATVDAEVLTGNRGPERRMLGAYLLGAYRLGAFEPGLRLERLDEDLAEAEDCITALTLACNWYPYRKVQLKANAVSNVSSGQPFEHKLVMQAQVGF